MSYEKKVKKFADEVCECLEESEDYEEIWKSLMEVVEKYAREELYLMDEDEAVEYAWENVEPMRNEGYY